MTTDVTDASDNWAIAVRDPLVPFGRANCLSISRDNQFLRWDNEAHTRATIFFLLFLHFSFSASFSFFLVISLYRFFRFPLLILAINPLCSRSLVTIIIYTNI